MKSNYLVGVILLIFFCPIVFLIYPIFCGANSDIANNLLIEYIFNSLIITSIVGLLTFIMGIIPACLISFYQFPGRKIVKYLMIFPLALPVYINALSYCYFIDNMPILKYILYLLVPFDGGTKWHNLISQIFIMSVSYYPYLYIICLPKLNMVKPYVMISISLNKSMYQSIKSIAIPLCRPAIITGISLIMIEVISDFGSSHLLGITTFTTGIYRAWFLLEDLG